MYYIDQRRQRNTEGLGNHDQPLHTEGADAEGAAGFLLALEHRDQAATMNLRHISRFGHHQGQQAGIERIGQYRAGARDQLRQVVDEHHQHQ
jgi:hypothetical protein